MGRGAKPGENRFKSAQLALVGYRKERLITLVKPKLQSLSHHVSIDSINKFCKLASEIYNNDLPSDQKKISDRRLKTNALYWEIIGPIYYKNFSKDKTLENFKQSSLTSLDKKREAQLKAQIKSLKQKNRALSSSLALNNIDEVQKSDSVFSTSVNHELINSLNCDIDNLSKIISCLINKFQGVIEVSLDEDIIRDLSDDLESPDGILPKEVVEPYIRWLKKRNSKIEEILNK